MKTINLVHQLFTTAGSRSSLLLNPHAEGTSTGRSFQDLLSTLQENMESVSISAKEDNSSIDEVFQKLRIQLNDFLEKVKSYHKETERERGQELEQVVDIQNQLEAAEDIPSGLQILISTESVLKKLQESLVSGDEEGTITKEDVKDQKVLELLQTMDGAIHSMQKLREGTVEQKVKIAENVHSFTGLVTSHQVQSKTSKANYNFEKEELKLQNLWSKFQQNIHTLENNNRKAQTLGYSSKVLILKDVIQSISELSYQVPKEKWTSMLNKLSEQGTEFENKLFKDLWQMYRNRQTVPPGYQHLSPINGKEFGKWISQYIEKHQDNRGISAPSLQTMPMSKVEQHFIQLYQNQSSSAFPNQLIKEMERILQSSRWFTSKPVSMEMQLKLKPQNLGEMTIKLAQINGELTVKIVASSQVAKDMLESNMSQLRHMFSPQQVVIEKNEGLTDQQSFQSFKEEDGHEEQQEKQSTQMNSESEEQSEEEVSFYEILMNEKV
ncbi:flagellar hook-length control protein FliK [Halobacillus sp. K22]|uniref:flagellar hook-length control protein FliK n=1 Tax=Halobacillus sp. K22 TaxID=3457431 RepID=UPI003FCE2975